MALISPSQFLSSRSELEKEFCAPYPGFVDIAGVIGEVDTANRVVFIRYVSSEEADFVIPTQVTIADPQPTFELSIECVLYAFVEKILSLAFPPPVAEEV